MKVVTAKGEGFRLSRDGQLFLVGSEKKEKAKRVGKEEASSIESRALRLVWASGGVARCSLYATVEVGAEKAKICEESLAATGTVFGLLQEMRAKF